MQEFPFQQPFHLIIFQFSSRNSLNKSINRHNHHHSRQAGERAPKEKYTNRTLSTSPLHSPSKYLSSVLHHQLFNLTTSNPKPPLPPSPSPITIQPSSSVALFLFSPTLYRHLNKTIATTSLLYQQSLFTHSCPSISPSQFLSITKLT